MEKKKRNLAGTSSEEWCNWELAELQDMEGTLVLQQYLQQLLS